jgi:cytochrome c556
VFAGYRSPAPAGGEPSDHQSPLGLAHNHNEGDRDMLRAVLAIATIGALGLGITAAVAQDPIAARKQLMKDTGAQAQVGAKMARGEEPFTVDKAKAIFAQYQKTSATGPTLFPENSKTGGDTAALPVIWQNKSDFEAKLKKLGDDAKAAEGKVTNLDTFKAEFSTVQRNCGGCHETYRAKKS